MKAFKTIFTWVCLVGIFCGLFWMNRIGSEPLLVSFESFKHELSEGMVRTVRIHDNKLRYSVEGHPYEQVTVGPIDDALIAELNSQGVAIEWGEATNWTIPILSSALPLILLLAALIYFAKRSAGANTNILSLRKSNPRTLTDAVKVTFEDVGGCAEAKESLRDVIDFLRDPKRWQNAGIRLPRGVLLEGPPGCGKTLLARAVAGETDASFFMVAASEFVEMFVGVGAARVRDLFETAAESAPAVIFIDELDAVGRRRGSGVGAAHDEREQTLNQLLVCLDGIEHQDKIVVIAATNRPDILDRALLRTGRFDRRVSVPQLDDHGRLEVLKIHLRGKRLNPELLLEELVEWTQGLGGSDLESLINEAGLYSMRRTRGQNGTAPELTPEDFRRALQPLRSHGSTYNKLDLLLIESAAQVAQPTGRVAAQLVLKDGSTLSGDIVWADANFAKVRDDAGCEHLVPKEQLLRVEALGPTEPARADEVGESVWALRQPDLA